MADIILQNERLKVTVSEPGSLYRRQRFDWCGIVTDVCLDGKHTFISKEPELYNENGGGYGLSSGFEALNGFEYITTAPGDLVPRLGAGLFRRADRSAFSVYRDVEIEPAHMEWQAYANEVKFITYPMPCNGYSFRLEKHMLLVDDRLETHYSVTNVGEKSVILEEFNHNYTMINNIPVNKDYEFRVPYRLGVQMSKGRVVLGYNTLSVEDYDDFFLLDLDGFQGVIPHDWSVVHKPSGVGYSEKLYGAVSHAQIWGAANNFCPETFYRFNSVPGQTDTWKREHRFFVKEVYE